MGHPKTIDDAQIIAATPDPPPMSPGVTHWSSRLLGRQLGISGATVARAWHPYRGAGVGGWMIAAALEAEGSVSLKASPSDSEAACEDRLDATADARGPPGRDWVCRTPKVIEVGDATVRLQP
jgi:hypothetical protein